MSGFCAPYSVRTTPENGRIIAARKAPLDELGNRRELSSMHAYRRRVAHTPAPSSITPRSSFLEAGRESHPFPLLPRAPNFAATAANVDDAGLARPALGPESLRLPTEWEKGSPGWQPLRSAQLLRNQNCSELATLTGRGKIAALAIETRNSSCRTAERMIRWKRTRAATP